MANTQKRQHNRSEEKNFGLDNTEAIISLTVVLLALGTINVFSSSFILAESEFDTPYFFLQRHAINICIGVVAMLTCSYFDYHIWRKKEILNVIFLLTFAALIAVLLVGPSVNGARRWLTFASIQIQPAEFAKLLAIMRISLYIFGKLHNEKKLQLLSTSHLSIFILFGLTEFEPDMGTASIILGIPIIMLIISGLDKSAIIKTVAIGICGAIALIIREPYRLERLKVTYDPWSDAQNVGYQTVQSLSAIGSGKLTGIGIGVGFSKYNYLPESHTDFAFAIFCQENGFLGALFIFILFAVFAIYAARISSNARDEYGQILAMGIMILIVGQAIANLLMVGGMFPVVGIPLPFISYGGTSLIVTLISIGILINIGRNAKK